MGCVSLFMCCFLQLEFVYTRDTTFVHYFMIMLYSPTSRSYWSNHIVHCTTLCACVGAYNEWLFVCFASKCDHPNWYMLSPDDYVYLMIWFGRCSSMLHFWILYEVSHKWGRTDTWDAVQPISIALSVVIWWLAGIECASYGKIFRGNDNRII